MANYRLGLCLAAIAIVIVVVPADGGLLSRMDAQSGGYRHRVARNHSFRSSSSASSAAYSSGGDSQAAAEAATGNGRSSYAQGFASTGRNRRQRAQQPVYYDYDEPAQFEDYGDSSEAASRAGFGGSFANAEAQSAYGGYSAADASAYSQDRHQPRYRRPVKNTYTGQRKSPPPPAPDVYRPSSPSVPTTSPEQRFASGPSVSSSIAATSGGIAAAGAAGNVGSSTSATVSSGGPRAGQYASARSGHNRRPGRFYGRPEEYYGEDSRQEPYEREGSVASSAASATTGAGPASAASARAGPGPVSGASSRASPGPVSAASARAGPGPASAAMASAQHDMHEFEDEEEEESFSVPETVNEFSSRAGSYAGNGDFQESGSYVRAYEDDQSYEQGDEEGDSYFAAKSHGKAYDANINEVSHIKNEDTFKGKDYTHTKKNVVFKSVNGKISDHETGSSVKGKDRHRAQYNRGNRKVRDYLDQAYNRNGPGAVTDNHLSEVSGFDEETADSYDSRGMGNFAGRRGPSPRRPNLAEKAAAAAAASATASSAGVTSSTSAAKN